MAEELTLEIITPEKLTFRGIVDEVTIPGTEGKFVPVAETVRGFKEILDGKHDDLPEQAFYMVGGIEEVVEKAKKLAE